MAVTFQETRLDNGLTVMAEIDPGAHSAAAGFFVKTGARDESPAIMGVSHFLEHMMFKGTDELSADDINRGFDELGARNNAYTTSEVTCFYAHVLPEFVDAGLALLAKMMRPAIRQDDFDTEKSVILEEIAMYKDNPFWVLYEETIDRFYRPHGLSHRVLGTERTVSDLTREQMVAYFNRRYAADNTVLSLAGAVDFDACVEAARALCGRWPRSGAERDESAPPTGREVFTLRSDRVNRAYLIGVSEAPGVGDDDRYAAAVLGQLLGGSDNSRLHWALIETGIAEEAQAAYDAHAGTGDLFVYASGDPGRIDQIREVIDAEIAGLIERVSDDDLERLRAKMATAATLGGERPNDRMQRLGRLWTSLGRYSSLEDELARISAVQRADLARVAERYPMGERTVGVMLPEA